MNKNQQDNRVERRLPAEWEEQSGVMIAWPHENTDWYADISNVLKVYVKIAESILQYQKLLVVCKDEKDVKVKLKNANQKNLITVSIPTNDTWARDFGPITVLENSNPMLLDFGFNGWGQKFPAHLDNKVNSCLMKHQVFQKNVQYQDENNFILEGGSIDTDGRGVLLTTTRCFLSKKRNPDMDSKSIEKVLKTKLGVEKLLWLNNGYLEGDDTDSHVDTLARFCNENTIAFVYCDDKNDSHYGELKEMENEIKKFREKNGFPYSLIRLPMADPVYDRKGNRLPASYANFLIINKAVLVPNYGTEKDNLVLEIFKDIFPKKEIIGIDSLPLIGQHGAIHCITMQLPRGVL